MAGAGGSLKLGVGIFVRQNLTTTMPQIMRKMRGYARASSNAGSPAQTAKLQKMNQEMGVMMAQSGIPLVIAGGFIRAAGTASVFAEEIARVRVVMGKLPNTTKGVMQQFFSISNATSVLSSDLAHMNQLIGTKGLADRLTTAQISDLTSSLAMFSKVAGTDAVTATNNIAELAIQLRLFDSSSPTIFRRFISTIQLVGKNSASNAKQVVEFVKALTPLKSVGKFSIPQIIALAGAVRSFGGEVNKNLIKTNIPAIFQNASSNPAAFAKMMGLGGPDQVGQMLNASPFEFFLKFLEAFKPFAGRLDDVNKQLKILGLSSKRIQPLVAGASNQIDLIRKILDKANKEFSGFGDTLKNDFYKVMNTLTQQMARFAAITTNISIALGTPFLMPLRVTLKYVNATLSLISKILTTDIGQIMAFSAGIVALFTGFVVAATVIELMSNVYQIGTAFVEISGAMASAFLWTSKLLGTFLGFFKILIEPLGKLFGRGFGLFVDNLKIVRSTVAMIIKEGVVPLKNFREIHVRGLLPMIRFFVRLSDVTTSFFTGFKTGFAEAFGEMGGEFAASVATMFRSSEGFFDTLRGWLEIVDLKRLGAQFGRFAARLYDESIIVFGWFIWALNKIYQGVRIVIETIQGAYSGFLTGGVGGSIAGGLFGIGTGVYKAYTGEYNFKDLYKSPGTAVKAKIKNKQAGHTYSTTSDMSATLSQLAHTLNGMVEAGTVVPTDEGRLGDIHVTVDGNLSKLLDAAKVQANLDYKNKGSPPFTQLGSSLPPPSSLEDY